jgi:hypothetical protein
MVPGRRSLKARCKRGLKQVLQFILPARWIIWRGRKNGQAIALTFDDGPHPEWTPKVLDTLLAFKAKATFFLVGEKARNIRRSFTESQGRGRDRKPHPESPGAFGPFHGADPRGDRAGGASHSRVHRNIAELGPNSQRGSESAFFPVSPGSSFDSSGVVRRSRRLHG